MSGGRGKSRWSRADNLDVMRCYCRATAPGQPTRGYIKRMHQEWTKLRPDRLVTAQRLSDQYRFVKRSRKFGQEELDELQRGETPEDANTAAVAFDHVILSASEGATRTFQSVDSDENAGVSCTSGDSGTGELGDDRELSGGSSEADVLGKGSIASHSQDY